jgi:hypothetical protein
MEIPGVNGRVVCGCIVAFNACAHPDTHAQDVTYDPAALS